MAPAPPRPRRSRRGAAARRARAGRGVLGGIAAAGGGGRGARAQALGAMTFTGIFVPGLNTRTYLANPLCRVETFFQTPQLKAAGAASQFLPLCYADILARLKAVPIDAALFMATPPDARGLLRVRPRRRFPRRALAAHSGADRAYQSASAARRRAVPHPVR